MLNNKEEIENWLKQYNIENYIINEDLSVSVNGNVNLYNKKLQKIPIKFNKVTGYFNCAKNYLTSLEFCPKEIYGAFDCANNYLTSLEYCPEKINGNFYVENNFIKKEKLFLFDSDIKGDIISDLGNKKKFLFLVLEKKILKEKENLMNNLDNKDFRKLIQKRL